jgi:hypothetical protein
VPLNHVEQICIGACNHSSTRRDEGYPKFRHWRGHGKASSPYPKINAHHDSNRLTILRMEDALLDQAKADDDFGPDMLKNVNSGGGGALGLRYKEGKKTKYASDEGGYFCYLMYKLNEAGRAAERAT